MADIDLSAFSNVVALGGGGLGDVYRATRRSTGSEVAIKVLRDWSDRDVAFQRVQRELRALVDLRGHPHVVNVEELIESDGALAIVMEFAPGGSISDLMRTRGGTLGLPETLLVATHTADALAASHALGIIHRDIKPHNLLIGAFGQVKVCDFGIAALTHSEAVTNRTNSLSLRYASPEELRGDAEVGAAADVYSLGATIHQILTGQYLPQPDGTAGTLPLRSWAAPDDLPGDVELEFRTLIVDCAQRDPGRRPTAAALLDRCEELASRLGPSRSRALPVGGVDLDDATRVRSVSVMPPPESPVPIAPAPRPQPAAPADTVVHTTSMTMAAPAGATDPGHRGRSPLLVASVTAAVALLALVGVALVTGWFGGDDDGSLATAGDSEPGDDEAPAPMATSETTVAAVTTEPTAESAPAAAAATTSVTTAPATTTSTTAPATATPATTTSTTAPTTTAATLPVRYAAPTCPGSGACIEITEIDIVDGEYSILWIAGFTPDTGATHAHFFWDVYEPSQVGSNAGERAPWELTADQPFVPEGEMRLANRPEGANGICVTPADGNHAVIDPAYFDCVLLAPGATWSRDR